MALRTPAVAEVIHQNIATIARLEGEFDRKRTRSDRIADAIGNFTGSMTFVVVHLSVFALWIVGNSGLIPDVRPWDKFPYLLLSLVVSLEAVFLSTFVLIKQSRMSRRADERAHLDLQINLLAEREMTVVLRMLQAVCDRLDIEPPDDEVQELAEKTPVEAVAGELQKAIAEEQPTS